jgi:hypothetical protein
LIATLSLAAASSPAAVLQVPGDYDTIWEAVDAAAPGDSVLVGPGTWTFADSDARLVQLGDVVSNISALAFLRGGVSVIAEQGPSVTLVDGSGGLIPFVFANEAGNGEATLEGFHVFGADQKGVVVAESDLLRIANCEFVDANLGSSVALIGGCFTSLVVEDSEFLRNTASTIVLSADSSLTVRRCRFEDNAARPIAKGSGGFQTPTVITDCVFTENVSSRGGGVVLTAAGQYTIERNLFLRCVSTNPVTFAGAVHLSTGYGSVQFNTFAFDSAGNGGGALLIGGNFGGGIVVNNNTFYGCYSPGRGSAAGFGSLAMTVSHNIFAGCQGGEAVSAVGTTINSSCNDFWNNMGGDVSGWTPDPTDFFLDPLFCDASNLDFTLRSNSPCAPGNNPACGQVGAFGADCGSVSIESASWGKIKSLYR